MSENFNSQAKPLTKEDLQEALKKVNEKVHPPQPMWVMSPVDFVWCLLAQYTGQDSEFLPPGVVDRVLDEFRRLRASTAESIVEKLATCPREQYDTVKKLAQNFVREREEERKGLGVFGTGDGSEEDGD